MKGKEKNVMQVGFLYRHYSHFTSFILFVVRYFVCYLLVCIFRWWLFTTSKREKNNFPLCVCTRVCMDTDISFRSYGKVRTDNIIIAGYQMKIRTKVAQTTCWWMNIEIGSALADSCANTVKWSKLRQTIVKLERIEINEIQEDETLTHTQTRTSML